MPIFIVNIMIQCLLYEDNNDICLYSEMTIMILCLLYEGDSNNINFHSEVTIIIHCIQCPLYEVDDDEICF